ncbi:unnamed protein product [Camellia sinensis]
MVVEEATWFQEVKGSDFSSEFVEGIADVIDVGYEDGAGGKLHRFHRHGNSGLGSSGFFWGDRLAQSLTFSATSQAFIQKIELDWILKMGITKLIHYVATLREQLEQLAEERTSDGLPRVSKAQVNDYSEKIEALAAKLAAPVSESVLPETLQPISVTSVKESPSKAVGESSIPTSPGLRRRFVAPSNIEDRPRDSVETDYSAPVKLDAAARTHIDKHRKLQDDLTDEMVGLAQQLKESSLMMSQSLQNTEKILDSTEQAVEQSLASTGRANI